MRTFLALLILVVIGLPLHACPTAGSFSGLAASYAAQPFRIPQTYVMPQQAIQADVPACNPGVAATPTYAPLSAPALAPVVPQYQTFYAPALAPVYVPRGALPVLYRQQGFTHGYGLSAANLALALRARALRPVRHVFDHRRGVFVPIH